MEAIQWMVGIGIPALGFLWRIYSGVHRRNTIMFDMDLHKRLVEEGQTAHAKLVQHRIDVLMRREYVTGPDFPIWRVGMSLYLLAIILFGAGVVIPWVLSTLSRGPRWDEWLMLAATLPGAAFLLMYFSNVGGSAAGALVVWFLNRARRDRGEPQIEEADEE